MERIVTYTYMGLVNIGDFKVAFNIFPDLFLQLLYVYIGFFVKFKNKSAPECGGI